MYGHAESQELWYKRINASIEVRKIPLDEFIRCDNRNSDQRPSGITLDLICKHTNDYLNLDNINDFDVHNRLLVNPYITLS
jgi:hypothetical protein